MEMLLYIFINTQSHIEIVPLNELVTDKCSYSVLRNTALHVKFGCWIIFKLIITDKKFILSMTSTNIIRKSVGKHHAKISP